MEFEFQSWKKIIVHEVVKFPLQHFITSHSLGVQAGGIGGPLVWADGIIFEKSGLGLKRQFENNKTKAPEWWEIYNDLKHDVGLFSSFHILL